MLKFHDFIIIILQSHSNIPCCTVTCVVFKFSLVIIVKANLPKIYVKRERQLLLDVLGCPRAWRVYAGLLGVPKLDLVTIS